MNSNLWVRWWGKDEPIHISVRPDGETGDSVAIRNVRFSNILAESEAGILVYGTENRLIRDLSFDRIRLRISGGRKSDAVGGNFDLRGLGAGKQKAIFKHDIPGMYCQWVDGLSIRDFAVEWADALPGYFSDALHVESFRNLDIDGFRGRQAGLSGSVVALLRGRTVSIRNSSAEEGTDTFLFWEDVEDRRLFVGNDTRMARKAVGPKQWSNNSYQ